MEKDLHNDRLEDYVKKSFGDYEEMPPGDMWSRIEVELPSREPASRPLLWLCDYKWQIAAASVILLLLSRLLFVQSYYEQQLRSMASQNHNASSSVAAIPASEETERVISRFESKLSSGKSVNARGNHIAPVIQSAGSKNISHEGALGTSGNNVNKSVIVQDAFPEQDSKTVQLVFNQSVGAFADFPLLPGSAPDALQMSNHASITPAANLLVKPAGGGRKWYLFAGVAPGLMMERHRKFQPGAPGPVFASRSEAPQATTSFSLRLGRRINRNIAIESGLGYQEVTRQTIHKPRFQFREGQTIPGGIGHHQQARSFQYDLNTYGGSASVTLRADVVGSNVPGENERVEAVIKSSEHIQLLQIPLSAVTRLGKGSVLGVIRAGVVGNYLVKSDFEVTAYQMDNPELRLQDNNAYTLDFHKPRRFIPGYQIALGAECMISRKLSVSAFPVITGDFPRKDPVRGGHLPGQATLAFTAAATYWF